MVKKRPESRVVSRLFSEAFDDRDTESQSLPSSRLCTSYNVSSFQRRNQHSPLQTTTHKKNSKSIQIKKDKSLTVLRLKGWVFKPEWGRGEWYHASPETRRDAAANRVSRWRALQHRLRRRSPPRGRIRRKGRGFWKLPRWERSLELRRRREEGVKSG